MPAKARNSRNPQPGKTAKPSKSELKGDSGPLWRFRFKEVNGRWARVENPFPNPAPEEVLLRVFRGVEKGKFEALEPRLRKIELGGGNLRMFLLAGHFLAGLSLKKTGRKHRLPIPSGSLGEMARAVSKLAKLSRLSEEIRQKIVNLEMFLELPEEITEPKQRLFCHDVIHYAPEVFEAYWRGTKSFVEESIRTAHPLVEKDSRLAQIEKALRPLKGDEFYCNIYNSRWALTAELIKAFGGKMNRKEIEKRTETKRFFSFLKRRSTSSQGSPLPANS